MSLGRQKFDGMNIYKKIESEKQGKLSTQRQFQFKFNDKFNHPNHAKSFNPEYSNFLQNSSAIQNKISNFNIQSNSVPKPSEDNHKHALQHLAHYRRKADTQQFSESQGADKFQRTSFPFKRPKPSSSLVVISNQHQIQISRNDISRNARHADKIQNDIDIKEKIQKYRDQIGSPEQILKDDSATVNATPKQLLKHNTLKVTQEPQATEQIKKNTFISLQRKRSSGNKLKPSRKKKKANDRSQADAGNQQIGTPKVSKKRGRSKAKAKGKGKAKGKSKINTFKSNMKSRIKRKKSKRPRRTQKDSMHLAHGQNPDSQAVKPKVNSKTKLKSRKTASKRNKSVKAQSKYDNNPNIHKSKKRKNKMMSLRSQKSNPTNDRNFHKSRKSRNVHDKKIQIKKKRSIVDSKSSNERKHNFNDQEIQKIFTKDSKTSILHSKQNHFHRPSISQNSQNSDFKKFILVSNIDNIVVPNQPPPTHNHNPHSFPLKRVLKRNPHSHHFGVNQRDNQTLLHSKSHTYSQLLSPLTTKTNQSKGHFHSKKDTQRSNIISSNLGFCDDSSDEDCPEPLKVQGILLKGFDDIKSFIAAFENQEKEILKLSHLGNHAFAHRQFSFVFLVKTQSSISPVYTLELITFKEYFTV